MMSDRQELVRLAYSVEESAKVLSVSPQFVRLEITRGNLHPARLGRRVLVTSEELRRYLDASVDRR